MIKAHNHACAASRSNAVVTESPILYSIHSLLLVHPSFCEKHRLSGGEYQCAVEKQQPEQGPLMSMLRKAFRFCCEMNFYGSE